MPANFDLSLEELNRYSGTNPRPENFDFFWDRTVALVSMFKPVVEWKRADFRSSIADCYDLRFESFDGSSIHVQVLLPKSIAKPVPAIIQFHGYSASSGDWVDKLAWVSAGFAVFSMDCRGQGGRSHDAGVYSGWNLSGLICRGIEEGPEALYFRHVFLDTYLLARLVASDERIDAGRIATIGGSQGGGLALACAGLTPFVKYTVAQYPFLCDYKRVWEIDLAKDAYDDLSIWLKRFSPTGKRHDELFNTLGYIDVHHLSTRVQSKVLFATGLMDTICPPSTQFAAYRALPGAKERVLYPQHGHEHLPGFWDQAFQWLVHEMSDSKDL